ncbi:hypothetical protein N431DRAFT_331984 [Stipitochalara longipes BDJ]|nr:hypothetical protein N431DRAFT_331984 [Stipitochalara longipes BDJ]
MPGNTASNRVIHTRAIPSFSAPEQQFVTIIVPRGPGNTDEDRFFIHKNVICFASPFFQSAFNSDFAEGQTQEMRLDDVHSLVFGELVHWLYTGKIERTSLPDDGGTRQALDSSWTFSHP